MPSNCTYMFSMRKVKASHNPAHMFYELEFHQVWKIVGNNILHILYSMALQLAVCLNRSSLHFSSKKRGLLPTFFFSTNLASLTDILYHISQWKRFDWKINGYRIFVLNVRGKYDVISQLCHNYAKDPLCVTRLIYLCVAFIACIHNLMYYMYLFLYIWFV